MCSDGVSPSCHKPREEQSTFWPWLWLFQSPVLHELKGKGDIQYLEREMWSPCHCARIPGPLGLPAPDPGKRRSRHYSQRGTGQVKMGP